jgi:phospholipase/carboxylesterase
MNETLRDVRSDSWGAERETVALLLHGYGSHERDLAGLADALELTLPWASLRAPLLVGAGAAWFPITTPGNPDPEPVAYATAALWRWVDAHVPAAAKIVPIGFSQGGLMASQLMRTRPDRVLATVILGGFTQAGSLPGDDAIAASRPPVFWGRGDADRVIAPAAIARTSAFLPTHSNLVERVYAGLGHSISAAELADVRQFLAAHAEPEAVERR